MGSPSLTPELIAKVWDKLQNSKKTKPEIAEKYHIPYSTVSSIERSMPKYLFNFNEIGKVRQSYVKAREIVLGVNVAVTQEGTIVKQVHTSMTIDEAIAQLGNELKALDEKRDQIITDFVIQAIDTQVHDIKLENEELKQVKEKAYHSNLITNLTRHFQGR